MKALNVFVLIAMLSITQVFAQTKSGITSFVVNGFVRGMSTMENKPDPDLNFVGESTAKIGDSLLADIMLTYSEQALAKFLGHEIYPVNRVRGANVPTNMNGNLVVMETISEKKAFKELGYDEIVTLNCQLGFSSMRTVKGTRMYVPSITLNIKVVGKDGKTIYKKNELLKLKDRTISGELIEERQDNSQLDISLKNIKTVTVDTGADTQARGVSSVELLDWYKQVLDNVLIK